MGAELPGTGICELLGVNRSVTVYASAESDARFVDHLLEAVGAKPRLSSSDSFIEATQESEEPCFATVVVHRVTDEDLPYAPLEKHRNSRIIVMSDCNREQTVVGFLKRGARHFFDIRESETLLEARIAASLRQHQGVLLRPLVIGDIHFDVQKRQVTRAGVLVQLSPKEYEFASRVFSNIDQVVSNSELMTSVWSLPPHMDTRRIDTAACRVRKKLRLCTDHGWELKRIRRVGYRLTQVGCSLSAVVTASEPAGVPAL